MPDKTPIGVRDLEGFLAYVRARAGNLSIMDETEEMVRGVLRVLAERVTRGELDNIAKLLPRDVAALLPADVEAAADSHAGRLADSRLDRAVPRQVAVEIPRSRDRSDGGLPAIEPLHTDEPERVDDSR
jgi:uncharacterized protein (DUF2267 family)